MCIFVQTVQRVKNTQILVAPLVGDRQLTCYMNWVSITGFLPGRKLQKTAANRKLVKQRRANLKNAMILPVPSGQPITIVDLSKMKKIFETLDACFPKYFKQRKGRSKSPSKRKRSSGNLEVHKVCIYITLPSFIYIYKYTNT